MITVRSEPRNRVGYIGSLGIGGIGYSQSHPQEAGEVGMDFRRMVLSKINPLNEGCKKHDSWQVGFMVSPRKEPVTGGTLELCKVWHGGIFPE